MGPRRIFTTWATWRSVSVEAYLPPRRLGADACSHRRHGACLDHDSRCRPVVLGSLETEERLVDALPLDGRYRRRIVPVVLLGLLARLLGHRLGVYWQLETLRPHRRRGPTIHWIVPNPRPPLLRLPMHVCRESIIMHSNGG